ncbi:uncharacterized protein LOC109722574 [Ananas comosus]|uniref:Uncharacterized protein LOC109722574 n=1 Tax=Ananas comosus TaxID=4615 RepID=A0A6P5GEF8_ANACO|nr:uncharacterized protein LOC109722574 [Ananas comosus]
MTPFFVPIGEFVSILNGSNYSKWKEQIMFILGYMDLDLALRAEQPPKIVGPMSPQQEFAQEKWERSNRLSLMLIKSRVSKSIRGSIPKYDKAKDYLKAIEEQFVNSDKVLASTLMDKLSSTKYSGNGSIRKHIMEMRDIAAQLTALEVTISDSFLVHFILNSLPSEYGPFQISYNTHKDKWSINELLTMCVQKEGRLIQETQNAVNFVSQKRHKAC